MKKITLPGSKSITNRDFILASLANGKTILKSILVSDDTIYMIKALKQLGITINENGKEVEIYGEQISGKNEKLFLGQSGTCIRFLTALAVLNKDGSIVLEGDERLNKRPLKDLLDGIRQMGIKVESNNDLPPVKIYGGEIINNKIKMNGTSSSQFFTGCLQIAPLIKGGLEIEVLGDLVSKPYIDLTINEMKKFGVEVENYDYKKFVVREQKYVPQEIEVEGDASALSYIANFVVLHGGEIEVTNIGSNTKQGDYKYLDVMKKYFDLEYTTNGTSTILKSSGLKPFSKYLNKIDFESMPDVSMSFMTMAIFLKGDTKITGLQTLNLKESKRIDAMKNELEKLGVKVVADEKTMIIGEYDTKKHNKVVDIETYNDHRIAMVFGVLNTFIGNMNILNPSCVRKTYPDFWKDLEEMDNG